MSRRVSMWFLAGLLLVAAIGCTSGPAEQKEARLIPMEDFFRNPDKTGYQLSPDGEHISFLAPWNNRLNVHVQKIGSDEATRITKSTERDISGYLWLNNNRIGWIQDTGGDENWHAYAVNIDGSNYLDATPFDGVQVRPVDVCHSEWDCTLERIRRGEERFAVCMGLRYVKGLSADGVDRILTARDEQAFASLDDLVRRTRLPVDELTVLAEAGAFDGLGVDRRQALWEVRALVHSTRASDRKSTVTSPFHWQSWQHHGQRDPNAIDGLH